jgi:mannose-6-phosphate isomerase-like protein (cupin superfamily)
VTRGPGARRVHLRDGDVALKPGEMFVGPRGVEHKPSAIRECRMMLIEPAGTPNTGDAPSDRTAPDNVWV